MLDFVLLHEKLGAQNGHAMVALLHSSVLGHAKIFATMMYPHVGTADGHFAIGVSIDVLQVVRIGACNDGVARSITPKTACFPSLWNGPTLHVMLYLILLREELGTLQFLLCYFSVCFWGACYYDCNHEVRPCSFC